MFIKQKEIMLNPQIITYGTDNPEQLMDKFYQAGNDMLLALRNYVINPEKEKNQEHGALLKQQKWLKFQIPPFESYWSHMMIFQE